MPLAVITITLDPVLRLSETSSVRYETIALAVVLLLGLLIAGRIASRTPSGDPADPAAGLRIDDLVFITVGAVPGAIVGGRLGYVLDHLEYYRVNASAILDPGQGGLTLTLAVPFGIVTGAMIARLVGAPVGRWMQAAAAPLLFVLAAGKLVGVLGGTGQGWVTEVPWATAYAGPGPWGSLAADVPAHPAQVYEALLVATALPLLYLITRTVGGSRWAGTGLFIALGLWAAIRVLVATTWRDPAVVGPLRMDQVLAIGVLAIALMSLAAHWRAPVRAGGRSLDVEGHPA